MSVTQKSEFISHSEQGLMLKGLRVCEQTRNSIADRKKGGFPYDPQARAVVGKHKLLKQNQSGSFIRFGKPGVEGLANVQDQEWLGTDALPTCVSVVTGPTIADRLTFRTVAAGKKHLVIGCCREVWPFL